MTPAEPSPPPAEHPPAVDPVVAVVEQVRRDLAARRASGAVPPVPPGELEQHFSAVAEAADSGFVDDPPLHPGDLGALARNATWRPGAGSGPIKRALGRLLRPLTDLVEQMVRSQVAPFVERTTQLVETITERQNRLVRFLMGAHLDRLRGLEQRVAVLEQEIERLRAEREA